MTLDHPENVPTSDLKSINDKTSDVFMAATPEQMHFSSRSTAGEQSKSVRDILEGFRIASATDAAPMSRVSESLEPRLQPSAEKAQTFGVGEPALKPDSDLASTVQFLQDSRNSSDVNYQKILGPDAQVLTLGDYSHKLMGSKNEFIEHLQELKNAGITHIGFELLPQSMQGQIDTYYKCKEQEPGSQRMLDARNQILEHFKNVWNSEDDVNNKLMDMVDGVHDAGLQMLAIEPDMSGMFKFGANPPVGVDLLQSGLGALPIEKQSAFEKYFTTENQAEARAELLSALKQVWKLQPQQADQFMRVLDSAKSSGLDLSKLRLPITPENDGDRWSNALTAWRNNAWASKIDDLLKQPGNPRVAVFAGAGHFSFGTDPGETSLNDELKTRGIRSVAVQYTGSDLSPDKEPPNPLLPMQENVMTAATLLNRSRERFAVRLESQQPTWLVHLRSPDQMAQ